MWNQVEHAHRVMTQLVKQAPPLIKKTLTTSTWQHQRISDHNIFLTLNHVFADASMMPPTCVDFSFRRVAHVLPIVSWTLWN
jgi:hypothetical protein